MQLISRASRSANINATPGKANRKNYQLKGNLHGRIVAYREQVNSHQSLTEAPVLPFVQRRHYSQKVDGKFPTDPTAGIDYFKKNGFSELQIEQIKKSICGVTFRVIPIPEDSYEMLKTTERFINIFFKSVVQSHPDSSALGGEQVLNFNPAKPDQGKPDSSYFMYFEGKQDKHYHEGPRHLDLWSSKRWHVTVGGSVFTGDKELSDSENHFTTIQFPPGHVSLSFAEGILHGFSGAGIGAISTHWTDAEELAAARSKTGVNSDTSANDVMGTLTKFVDQEKIRIIGDQSIPWYAISALQASQRNEPL